MREDAARRAFDEAFPAMSAELPEIDKRGKIIIKAKDSDRIIQSTPYALWEDTNRLIAGSHEARIRAFVPASAGAGTDHRDGGAVAQWRA